MQQGMRRKRCAGNSGQACILQFFAGDESSISYSFCTQARSVICAENEDEVECHFYQTETMIMTVFVGGTGDFMICILRRNRRWMYRA
jgi:hypothetical protein